MRIQYRPLPAIWPSGTRTQYRQRARFKTAYQRTMAGLDRELRFLGVAWDSTLVIEAGYQEHEIRVDGMPRANARPLDPAVVLNFDSKFGPLRYGCDTYMEHMDNLRAIVLALEALRAVDRYGVTKRGEQYVGWKALPATSQSSAEALVWMTREAAALGLYDGSAPRDFDPLKMYRELAKRMHPDHAGDGAAERAKWDELQRVKVALGL